MGDYKEHKIFSMLRRKGIITTYIVIIAIVLIVSITLIVKAVGQKEIQSIVYEENSNIDYKVYLNENEFFEGEYLEKDNQYIASLINYIEADFNYELSSPEKGIDYKYKYKVLANIEVQDDTTKKPLYEKQDVLIEEKQFVGNTDWKLKINEPIRIDYNLYNELIKKFVNIYDLDDIDSTLTISMYVDLVDDEEEKNTEQMSTPVMTLKIPLTEKTMAIELESKTVNGNSIVVDKTLDTRGYLFIAVVLIFVDLIIVKKLLTFMKDTENEKAIYNAKLRKIMVSYGSYIQKVNNEFNFDEYQILEIDIFEDLLQIRETVNKPVLMIEKELPEETYFFIPTEKNVYLYEIKKGNFLKNREKRYKIEEEQKR